MNIKTKVEPIVLLIFCSLLIIVVETIPEIPAKTKVTAPPPIIASIKIEKGRLPENPNKPLIASWYDYRLDGIKWSLDHSTAASRDFPRYSTVLVTNIDNGKSVEVFINDYGPMSCEDRIKNKLDTKETCIERHIDLSSYAFDKIGDKRRGLINVKIE